MGSTPEVDGLVAGLLDVPSREAMEVTPQHQRMLEIAVARVGNGDNDLCTVGGWCVSCSAVSEQLFRKRRKVAIVGTIVPREGVDLTADRIPQEAERFALRQDYDPSLQLADLPNLENSMPTTSTPTLIVCHGHLLA